MSRSPLRSVGVVAAVVALAVGALWVWRTSGTLDAEEGGVADVAQVEHGSPTDQVPEGDYSVTGTDGASPAEVEERCGRDDGSVDPECRIVGTLDGDDPRKDPQLPLLEGRSPSSLGRPAIPDAADPHVLVDGLTYHFFSTSAEYLHVPLAVVPARMLVDRGVGVGYGIDPSSDLLRADGRVNRIDAMPDRPPWAAESGIWAPTVERLDGRYVMFFAAKRPGAPDPINQECVGRAVASKPQGPYAPDPEPFTCGVGGKHGALDPSIFRASDGSLTLHVAYGGTATPLWSIPLASDGRAAGPAEPLLSMQHGWEYWFLENPSMIHDGTHYLLAYSAGDWRDPTYSTGLARCRTPRGPCRSEPSGPWLSSRGSVTGPGGLAFFHDVHGQLMAVHHGYPAGGEALYGARSTFIRQIELGDGYIAFR